MIWCWLAVIGVSPTMAQVCRNGASKDKSIDFELDAHFRPLRSGVVASSSLGLAGGVTAAVAGTNKKKKKLVLVDTRKLHKDTTTRQSSSSRYLILIGRNYLTRMTLTFNVKETYTLRLNASSFVMSISYSTLQLP